METFAERGESSCKYAIGKSLSSSKMVFVPSLVLHTEGAVFVAAQWKGMKINSGGSSEEKYC